MSHSVQISIAGGVREMVRAYLLVCFLFSLLFIIFLFIILFISYIRC